MLNFFHALVLFISGLLQMALQGAFLLIVFNKKLLVRRLALFAGITGAVSQITRLIPSQYNAALNMIAYIVIMFITLKYILNFKWLQCAMGICLATIFGAAATYGGMAIARMFLYGHEELFTNSNQFRIVLIKQNLGTLVELVVITLLYYMRMQITLPEDVSKKMVFGTIVNGIVMAAIILPNIFFSITYVAGFSTELIVFNLISVMVLLLTNIYTVVKFVELDKKNKEIEFQRMYINTLESVVNGLRGFKHDLNNMVQVIGGYIALNDIDGLRKYHLQLSGESNFINNVDPLNSYAKENPAMYGLFLSKLTYAEVKNVTLKINIMVPLRTNNMSIFDFCRVMGILIDNALEAAALSEKKYVGLDIRGNEDGKGLIIDILNSYVGEVDTEMIYQNGFTTKDGHSGFGLWEVKKIFEKYKGCLIKTSTDENLFVQHLEV